jgi:hypothetical protein
LKHVIQRYDWAERERRERIGDEVELWKDYVAEKRPIFAEALAKGESPPAIFPHPDDVKIDTETGVSFIGPLDEADLADLLETLKMRDALIMQGELDDRADDTPASDRHDRSAALPVAMLINERVPKRYRLSDIEFEMRMMRSRATSKRVLLKQVYRGWRELGLPMRRGQRCASVRLVMRFFDQFANLLKANRGPSNSLK